MKSLNYDKIVVIDVECTCDDADPTFKDRAEIIEIGAIIADLHSGEIVQRDSIIITPERTPITPFCTQLTTIDQKMIDDRGVSWREAVTQMIDLGYTAHPWLSWGDYDKNMIQRMIRQHGTNSPVSHRHINARVAFTIKHQLKREPGLITALKHLGLSFTGTHHRGIDDAVNIWTLAQTVFAQTA